LDVMNDLLDHCTFFEPEFYFDILNRHDRLPKDWIKIFYIARCLFALDTTFPYHPPIARLLNRREIFTRHYIRKQNTKSESLVKTKLSDTIDIGRINSVHEISHILPREFVTNTEDIFYKKLINRELCRKEFTTSEGLSISELVHGRDRELNRRQKVYVLFDNSYSMNGVKFNKIFTAKALCLEYFRSVQKERPEIFFRTFNQTMGPLVKINKPGQLRELMRHIVELATCECFATKIGDAILQAVQDIRSDPECEQAEILMITDGLGDIPDTLEQVLGSIQLHVVFISGIDVNHFLDLYPDKAAWEKANPEMGSRDMPSFWETFLKITQVYRLQEVAETFIRIPSTCLERFTFSNERELDMIRDTRITLAHHLEAEISHRERFEIYQKLRFIVNYLKTILSKDTPPALAKGIKHEIGEYESLLKRIKENEWFSHILEYQKQQGRRQRVTIAWKRNDAVFSASGRSNPYWVFHLAVWFLRNLSGYFMGIMREINGTARDTGEWISGARRRSKIKRQFDKMNNKIWQVLAR